MGARARQTLHLQRTERLEKRDARALIAPKKQGADVSLTNPKSRIVAFRTINLAPRPRLSGGPRSDRRRTSTYSDRRAKRSLAAAQANSDLTAHQTLPRASTAAISCRPNAALELHPSRRCPSGLDNVIETCTARLHSVDACRQHAVTAYGHRTWASVTDPDGSHALARHALGVQPRSQCSDSARRAR